MNGERVTVKKGMCWEKQEEKSKGVVVHEVKIVAGGKK